MSLSEEKAVISIFNYFHYRDFLKDRFAEEKKKRRTFSYRSFNRRVGIQSSSFLKLVVDGKRNLSEDSIPKVAKAFNLSSDEGAYFCDLVRFNQAKNHEEKDLYFRKIAHTQHTHRVQLINPEYYAIFSNWYHLAILEIVRIAAAPKTVKDKEWIMARLGPSVLAGEVQEALKRLTQAGLLVKTKKGYQRNNPILSSPDEVQSLYLVNLYRTFCDRAKVSISEDDETRRDFSSLTVAVSKKGFEKAREEILKFRHHLHALLESEELGEKEVVAHFNLHLFQVGYEQEKKQENKEDYHEAV